MSKIVYTHLQTKRNGKSFEQYIKFSKLYPLHLWIVTIKGNLIKCKIK